MKKGTKTMDEDKLDAALKLLIASILAGETGFTVRPQSDGSWAVRLSISPSVPVDVLVEKLNEP